jgi:hypothetical protein
MLKKVVIVVLSIVMCSCFVDTPFAATSEAQSEASDWAVESVREADLLELTTPELLNNFNAPTTRLEFCRAIVNLLRQYGYNINAVEPNIFADTNDTDVGIAAALGITSGTDLTKNLFSPDDPLTREQAVTLLNKVLDVIKKHIENQPVAWTDAADISSWALQSADNMYICGVISGTDTTKLVFSPKATYTHEQSIVTLLQMWKFISPTDDTETEDFIESDTTLLFYDVRFKENNTDLLSLVFNKPTKVYAPNVYWTGQNIQGATMIIFIGLEKEVIQLQ